MTMTNQCATPAIALGPADVCWTASGTPAPFPNIVMLATISPAFQKWLIVGGAPVTLGDIASFSSGDEAGAPGGVVSGMIMGPAKFTGSSSKVFAGAFPLTTMLHPLAQNGMVPNTVGMMMGPTQTKHFVLS